jgi:hypothetical protein
MTPKLSNLELEVVRKLVNGEAVFLTLKLGRIGAASECYSLLCICLSATATIVVVWGSLLQVVSAEDFAPAQSFASLDVLGPTQSADEGGPF